MGCYTYNVGGGSVKFNEGSDDVGCVCTFPHNDKAFGRLYHARELAYLGAAVAMMAHGEFDRDFCYIPDDLPEWVRRGIDDAFSAPEARDNGTPRAEGAETTAEVIK